MLARRLRKVRVRRCADGAPPEDDDDTPPDEGDAEDADAVAARVLRIGICTLCRGRGDVTVRMRDAGKSWRRGRCPACRGRGYRWPGR